MQVMQDGVDPLNASSLNQPPEVAADWIDFLRLAIAPYRGTRLWSNTTTYAAGMTVVDPSNSRIYRAKTTDTNHAPHSYPAIWDQCDYSSAEIQTLAALATISTSGIACSNGATASTATMLSFVSGAVKAILFSVSGIPYDDQTEVDLSGSTTKFESYCRVGICSLMSDTWSSGGGVVGYNPITDPNVFGIWAHRLARSSFTTCTAGVLLLGY
jgi:hypothetical protein